MYRIYDSESGKMKIPGERDREKQEKKKYDSLCRISTPFI